MNFAISTTRYHDDNFEYYRLSEENYKWLCGAFPEFSDPKPENFGDVILYALNKDMGQQKVKVGKVKKVEKVDNSIKIILEDVLEATANCEQVRKGLYYVKLNMGWVVKGSNVSDNLFAHPVSIAQYNKILHPALNTIKHADKITLLEQHKANKRWKDAADLFEPLSSFEQNFPEIWNDAESLDKITFALAKLSEPSDRLKKRHYYEPLYLKFNARTIELEPGNISFQKVRAYNYYNLIINKNYTSKTEKDYANARQFCEELVQNWPNDVTALYRLAKLNHTIIETNCFREGFDRRDINKCEEIYKKALAAYESCEKDEVKRRFKKDFLSALYNIAVINLDQLLDYKWLFFEIRLHNNDKPAEYMLNNNKYEQLKRVKEWIDRLFLEQGFDLQIPLESMICATDEDQIHVFYRAAQFHQYSAIVYNLLNKTADEKYRAHLDSSNQYIKKAQDLFHLRKSRGINGLPPRHLFGVRALNSYLAGEVDAAIESLLKGQDYSIYDAAQLLCIEKKTKEAIEALNKIPHNSLMYDKAKRLKEKIGV